MFTDFVCFQFYFRDYVAQPYSQIGTAYICSSIKVLSRNAQRRIFVDCAGVRFIIEHKLYCRRGYLGSTLLACRAVARPHIKLEICKTTQIS